MKKIAAWVLGAALVIYVTIGLLLYTNQRQMLYFPTPDVANTVAAAMRIESGGESLKIWHQARASRNAVLYFGGNAENVARSMATLRTAFPNHSIFAMNYRGYGGSSGEPSESALVVDAKALYDSISVDFDQISVMGRSLGSGVATQLASRRKVQRLVLVTPFDNIPNVVKELFWAFPVSFLLKDHFDSAAIAAQLSQPTLLLLAESDQVVARERSLALLAAFSDNVAAALVIDNTDHNSISLSPDYLTALRDFFAD